MVNSQADFTRYSCSFSRKPALSTGLQEVVLTCHVTLTAWATTDWMSEQLTKNKPMHWLSNGLWCMWPGSDKLGQPDFSPIVCQETHQPISICGGWEATGAICKIHKQKDLAKTEEKGVEIWTEASIGRPCGAWGTENNSRCGSQFPATPLSLI